MLLSLGLNYFLNVLIANPTIRLIIYQKYSHSDSYRYGLHDKKVFH